MTEQPQSEQNNNPDEHAAAGPDRLTVIEQRVNTLFNEACRTDTAGSEVRVYCSVSDVLFILKTLRDDPVLQFKQLTDLTAVDYPERAQRFDVVYQLLSVEMNARLRVLVGIEDGDIVPSAIDLFASANWAEREVWDMFGIFFSGHHDLRRLLTDYGFEGHPLRKDFPLTGYVEVRYNDSERRVVYEPVHLTQEYRDFDFLSPWEGMQMPSAGHDVADEAEGEA